MIKCLNCQSSIDETTKFCTSCGQKINISRLSIASILKDFFSNLFNLDNRIWQTLKDIWIPGKLSLAYIAGQRKKYYNPLRIFIISLFTLFTVFLLKTNDKINELNTFSVEQEHSIWKEKMMVRFDSLVQVTFNISDSLDLKEALFEINSSTDSIDISQLTDESIEELNDLVDDQDLTAMADINEIIDSLKENQTTNFSLNYTSKDGAVFKQPINREHHNDFHLFNDLRASDLYRLDTETLKSNYGKGDWKYEKGLEQLQKVFKDFSGSLKFLISNGTWAVIATILFMALIFKLLYIRHNYLYAEHFIFHIYGHTRMLLALLFIVVLDWIINISVISSTFKIIWALGCLFYLYKGMRKFYMQSRKKTVVKFIFTAILAYPFIITTCATLIFLLSLVFL